MNETDLQVLSSPGNLTESEIGIILKAQEDYQNLLKESYAKDKKILSLEKQIAGLQGYSENRGDWFLTFLGGMSAFVMLCVILTTCSYQSGMEKGLRWKQELCQIKHPRSASAYQSCLSFE